MLPVLENRWGESEFEEWGDQASRNVQQYLRKGTPFDPRFTQVPEVIPLDQDVDHRWKSLYLSRRALGMDDCRHLVPQDRLKDFDNHWNGAKLVGTKLNEFRLTDWGTEMGITRVGRGYLDPTDVLISDRSLADD